MITLIGKTMSKQSSPPNAKEKVESNSSFSQMLQKLSKKSISDKNKTLLLRLNDVKHSKAGNKKQINPQILTSLDTSSLKLVLKSAKNFLKSQIRNNLAFKDIKKMPNTIKGLLDLAKSLKININKITLIKVITKDLTQNTKVIDKTLISEKKIISKLPTKLENLLQTKIATAPLFSNSKKKVSTHLTQDLVKTKDTNKVGLKKVKPGSDSLTTILTEDLTKTKNIKKVNIKKANQSNNISISNLKQSKQELTIDVNATLKDKKRDTNAAQQSIQPNGLSHVNTDNQTFMIKTHEAKQMIKYLAHNIKQAIDEYKPPFTKIKIRLNPQKLGEVDLIIIQRGKNIHVNISSNTAAITTLAQNSSDLRVQLTQNGMNNASLNFSNSGNMSGESNAQQQQQQNARKFYQQFDDDKKSENTLNSLEILIPQYI